jgi:P4 family phage/plasmid primase-like protien
MKDAATTTRTFATGWGQSDTHAETLSDGRPNPSASAGLPYETITGGQIVAMVRNPPSVPKEQAQWFLPSDYHDADARSHDAQRTHGAFSWLVADIDTGNPSLEAVRAAVEAVVGAASRLIYSSRSAKPDNRKWRVLIPLDAPISGEDYPEIANAFFDLLEAEGLICDRTLSRPGQLIYLPNRGEHYQFEVHQAGRLKMGPDHPITRRAEDERQRREAVEREALARRDRQAKERAARIDVGGETPVDHFNANHTVEQLLGRYSYTQLRGSNDWRSPMQTSGSYATRNGGDYWISLSGSDAAAGIGAESKSGHRFGDAFDLFVHFEHGGDFDAAVKDYAREAGLSDSRDSFNLPGEITAPANTPAVTTCDTTQDEPPAPAAAVYAHGLDEDVVQALMENDTEDAVALAFAAQFNGRLIYSHAHKSWFEWDGKRWSKNETQMAFDFARRMARQAAGKSKSTKRAAFARGVETFAKADPRLSRSGSDFDGDNYLLCCPDGTYDLRTLTRRAHRPEDCITQMTRVAPDETGGVAFLRFLEDITCGDADLIDFLQVLLGSTLSGAVEDHWMTFWIGVGRNGKSTLAETVMYALGDCARKVPSQTLLSGPNEHPTTIANLQGIRFALSSEVEEGAFWNESRLKEITGDDTLSARVMSGNWFTFRRTQKHIVLGNSRPQIRSSDPGIQSRMKIVPFRANFKGCEDKTLPERLRGEAGFILAWLMKGHQRWMEQGRRLGTCAAVEAETADYFAEQSTPDLWITERCNLIRDDGRPGRGWPTAAELYADYRTWKTARGEQPLSQTRFGGALGQKLPKTTAAGVRYIGIELKPGAWS